jgi:phage gp36-like protein
MSLTVAELKVLSFGYLTGADLKQFCPPQLLIKIYEVDSDALNTGCQFAYSELKSSLSNRYNVDLELALTTDRNQLCVKIAAILAIRNILGDAQNISDKMLSDFTWADKQLISIRNGQIALGLKIPEDTDGNTLANYSNANLISSNFQTLG